MIKKMLTCISIISMMIGMYIMPVAADWQDDVVNNLTGGVTGKWKFKITPSIEIDDPTVQPSDWEVNLYDVHGAIVGYAGLFQFQGTRDKNIVKLNVSSRDGHKKINQKGLLYLQITGSDASGASAMEGSFTSNDIDLGYKGLTLSRASAKRTGNPPSIEELKAARADIVPLGPGEEALELSGSDWITKIITYIANKVVINELTWNSCHQTYDWMKAWDVVENGAGYYMSGDHGPGGRSYATWTFYYPLEWGHGGNRTYSFYFRSGPTYQTIDQMVFALQDTGSTYPKCLGFSNNSDLTSAAKDFHSKYGDFAISTAYDDDTAHADLYINLADATHCSEAKKHTLVKKIWDQLSDHDLLLCGHDIHDDWQLKRPYVLLDGTSLYITYVLGTINVHYD